MSVVTIETGTSFQSGATGEIKPPRVKRVTIDELDRALVQPISKEALAVECSTHFTHSKTIIEIRKNMIEATAKARSPTLHFDVPGPPQSWTGLSTNNASIPHEKRGQTPAKYHFNVAKSMASSSRKNEEEEAHKELKLGSLDVWALGIAVVIGGQYFGWNFSLSAGFGSCYIAMLMVGLAYLCLCLCNSGNSPFYLLLNTHLPSLPTIFSPPLLL